MNGAMAQVQAMNVATTGHADHPIVAIDHGQLLARDRNLVAHEPKPIALLGLGRRRRLIRHDVRLRQLTRRKLVDVDDAGQQGIARADQIRLIARDQSFL